MNEYKAMTFKIIGWSYREPKPTRKLAKWLKRTSHRYARRKLKQTMRDVYEEV